MMFFRSVAAVFKGVSAFPEFAHRNPFRALFHLFVFCAMASFLGSGIQTWSAGRKIEICTNGLQKQFGDITVSDQGILPERSAETPHTFYFPGNFRLDYLTADSVAIVREIETWKQTGGIFWVQRGFLAWIRLNPQGNLFYLGNLPFPTTAAAMRMIPESKMLLKPQSPEEIESILKKYQGKPVLKQEKVSPENYSFQEIGNTLKQYIYVMIAFVDTFRNFFLTLVMILMFSAMQALWKAPGLEKLGFCGTLSMLSYAAYPAVLAGVLLEAFSFRSIAEILYFVIFFLYQLLAFNELRRAGTGPEGPVDGNEK